MARSDPSIVMEKAAGIRLLILDVDGVLTDGSIVYTAEGVQVQSFHVHDGLGLKLLMKAGVRVVIISSRQSGALAKRASELGIDRIYQGVQDKLAVYREVLESFSVADEDVCAVGDDWVDLPILRRVGLSVAVQDASDPLRDYVDFMTSRPGGKGAVREVCDLILKARHLWGESLNPYLSV